ncbi:MAG: hypothetical protein ACLFQR_13670 [Desulfovibrionales bacterium]
MFKTDCFSAMLILWCSMIIFPLHSVHAASPVSFSADYIEVSDGQKTEGKYYAGPQGIRMEGVSDGEKTLMIVNFPQSVSWIVQVEEEMYYEMPFSPEDSGTFLNPCPELKKGKQAGRETMAGRSVEKWQCEGWDGSVDTVWFDDRLKATVRREGADGTVFELRNIKEGTVSKDLFQLPEGYTKIVIPGS